jgi:hypothetical protein
LANRKVTSPFVFYTPFERTPEELAIVELGNVGQDDGGARAVFGHDVHQSTGQSGVGQVPQRVAFHC